MGVLNMFSTAKTMNVPVESVLSHQNQTVLSPAVSSISSYGSGNFLVHGHQFKPGHKRKAVSLTIGRKHSSMRLTNIIWSGLFFLIIVATVVVVVALAENIRRTLWAKVSFKDDGSYQPASTLMEETLTKIQPGDGKTCVYQRIIWEHGSRNSEVIHDLSTKWSALIDHDEEQCLIFNLQNTKIEGCPLAYPWDLDLQVGVPSCRGLLARIAPIRKIMHHMCSTSVNLTVTGEAISTLCFDYKVLQIDKVTIEYYDRHLRRVARGAVTPLVIKSSTFTKNQGILEDPENEKANKYPQKNSIVLNKPTEKAGEGNPSIPTKAISKMDETSTSNPRNWEQFNASTPKVYKENTSIFNSPSPNIDNMSTVALSNKISQSENATDKPDKFKLISVLFANAKNNVKDNHIINANEPEEAAVYWEVVYKSVDQTTNKIFQARTLKDLMEMNKGVAMAGFQPLILLSND